MMPFKDMLESTAPMSSGVSQEDFDELKKIVAELEEKSEVMDEQHRDHVRVYNEE